MKKSIITPVILIASFMSLLFINEAKSNKLDCLKGSGKIATENRSPGTFTKIDLGGAYKVTLIKGSVASVKIECDENLISNIKTEVQGGTLIIKNEKPTCKSKETHIYITAVDLEGIKSSGAVEITSESKFQAERFEIKASGASSIKLDLDAKLLQTQLSGASELVLKGKADTHALETKGASNVKAYDFIVDKYAMKLTGASECDVYATSELNITGSGASEVKYKGNPQITRSTTGASDVKKIN